MALFTVKVLRLDRLVVVAETRATGADPMETQAWMSSLVEYVSRTNQVWIYALLLVPEGSLPKLTNGQPDPFQTKRKFLDGTLAVTHVHLSPEECIQNLPPPRATGEIVSSDPMDRLVDAVRGVEHSTATGPAFSTDQARNPKT